MDKKIFKKKDNKKDIIEIEDVDFDFGIDKKINLENFKAD